MNDGVRRIRKPEGRSPAMNGETARPTLPVAESSDNNGQIPGGQGGVTPRLNFGAPHEPATRVLHGAGQDMEGFRNYTEALGPGRHPILYMTYTSLTRGEGRVHAWGERVRRELDQLGHKALILQIGLNMTAGKAIPRDGEVAAGACDAALTAFVEVLRKLERSAFVRIGYEFDGPWNGYCPDTFRQAFVRVAQALRAFGPWAASVWNAAGCPSLEALEPYYPGDEWVDWWSINLFGRRVMDEHLPRFCEGARRHHRPVMIGESTPQGIGTLQGEKSWNLWFEPYFTAIRTHPEIKAFCYINWEWLTWSERTGHDWRTWGDGRIERNEEVLRRYREEMNRPLYAHLPSASDDLLTHPRDHA